MFIVETKNIAGWIFGTKDQPRWTQSLYGRNYSFQNPIRQVYRQKRILSEYLSIRESLIYTVIYFVGDCEFLTNTPSNVINSGLSSYIKQYKAPRLSCERINDITEKLNKITLESPITIEEHLKSLEERHNSSTICPRCGSNLIEKTARQGYRIGSKFLSCTDYPICRFIRNIASYESAH